MEALNLMGMPYEIKVAKNLARTQKTMGFDLHCLLLDYFLPVQTASRPDSVEPASYEAQPINKES